MTALTLPARPDRDASPRPVPWRRMAWVTWRQHRFALIGVAAPLAALALYLWIAGLHLHHAHSAASTCHPASSIPCSDLISRFNGMDKPLWNGYILQAVPALIGAFVGAPLLAREMETGTFRYAWTQGIGRWRWTLAKLVPLAVVVATAAGALSLLISWYYGPYFAPGNQAVSLTEWSPLAAGLFDLRGVGFAAWTLAAFTVGALAGMLVRRVVPAIVATLVAYTGLALTAGLYLRPHYLAPAVGRNLFNPPGTSLVVSQWWTKGGTFAFGGRPPFDLLQQFCPHPALGAVVSAKPSPGTLSQCLAQHGYTQWTRYQPASRFWSFQWIEAGWLLTLSALLLAATVWLVRRRAA